MSQSIQDNGVSNPSNQPSLSEQVDPTAAQDPKRRLLLKSGVGAAMLPLLGGLAASDTIAAAPHAASARDNVIFFHVDGFGLNHWGATRFVPVGPDGQLNWDRLPHMAVYRGHLRDALAGSSAASATAHAYGVRVQVDSFGQDGVQRIRSLSGFPGSIAHEALAGGKWVGLVNSAAAYESGTAAFLASTGRYTNYAEITRQLTESGVQVHLAGGERWYLPLGVRGRFGWGARIDGRNLINELRRRGYTVVFTRDELAAIPPTTERLWGIFAHGNTFNALPEEVLRVGNIPPWVATAPSIAEMSRAALAVLSRAPQGFLLVAEEEGTDNFSNANNASGALSAGRRADEAIGLFTEFVGRNPRTLMLTTADSDAGGMQVVGPRRGTPGFAEGQPLLPLDPNGAPRDGLTGTLGNAFMSAPDRNGERHAFAITWVTLLFDVSGAILVRGVGRNSELIGATGSMNNVDVYRLMYRTLFGTVIN